MLKIAILISGSGSNMDSILDSIDSNYLSRVKVVKIISDRDAKGIEKAQKRGFDTLVLDRKIYKKNLSNKILETLDGKVDYIVLAGFLSIIDIELTRKFENKIINIHPSLIPSFCGAGMYGMKVHQAAIAKGVKFSGCTVHFVNEEVDGGAIIRQEIVEVLEDDTPEVLQKRILKKEHKILPEVLKLLSEKRIELIDNKVKTSS
ncbi:MAG: phosphoribosylglycinamide formyltransferase [Sarcina sp.]